jgi:hypothetical protein
MKKFTFALFATILFFATSVQVQAQFASKLPLAAGDTVNNTGVATKTIGISGGYSGISIQANVQKLSGTVGGTIGIYASNDGTNYVQIVSDVTVTNTTGTKGYYFTVSTPLPRYVRVIHTGTGTMSSVLSVWYRVPFYQSN